MYRDSQTAQGSTCPTQVTVQTNGATRFEELSYCPRVSFEVMLSDMVSWYRKAGA